MRHRHADQPPALSRWLQCGLCSLVGLPCLWGTVPARAAAVALPPGVVQAAPAARPSPALAPALAPSAPPPPTLDLVTARLEAVDTTGLRVRLQGRWVALHPTALRVADGRGPRTLDSLRAGQQVRLALEPASPAATDRRIVLVIVEPAP